MSRRLRMAEEWDKFAREVIPAEDSAQQREEMRLAFYTGGIAVLFKIVASIGDGAELAASDVDAVKDLLWEMRAFIRGRLEAKT